MPPTFSSGLPLTSEQSVRKSEEADVNEDVFAVGLYFDFIKMSLRVD